MKTKSERVKQYLVSDFYRYTGKTASVIRMYIYTYTNHCFRFSFWFRLASIHNILQPYAKLRKSRISSRYGMLISSKTKIGYGLYIGHGYGIVVNSSAIIGNNCNLSQFTTIGSNDGEAAVIGNNVYIGPNVCLVENVHIGDNVTIGAGAVVTKNLPDNSTCAGVPAAILNYNAPARYIKNKWKED